MTNKTFTVVGITTINGVTKVRFTDDMVRRIKQFSKGGATRVDFIDLPSAMTKIEALKYMLTHKDFQSIEDQATIEETLADKELAFAKSSKVKTVSLDSIRKRSRKDVTVDDILTTIQ